MTVTKHNTIFMCNSLRCRLFGGRYVLAKTFNHLPEIANQFCGKTVVLTFHSAPYRPFSSKGLRVLKNLSTRCVPIKSPFSITHFRSRKTLVISIEITRNCGGGNISLTSGPIDTPQHSTRAAYF